MLRCHSQRDTTQNILFQTAAAHHSKTFIQVLLFMDCYQKLLLLQNSGSSASDVGQTFEFALRRFSKLAFQPKANAAIMFYTETPFVESHPHSSSLLCKLCAQGKHLFMQEVQPSSNCMCRECFGKECLLQF